MGMPVSVQTRADLDADIREDWRAVCRGEKHPAERIFRIDSLAAPASRRGRFAAAGRVRRIVGFIDAANGRRGREIESAGPIFSIWWPTRSMPAAPPARRGDAPAFRTRSTAIEEQRGLRPGSWPPTVQAELLTNRRPWENRLLGQAASRWGFSPFALVLRVYQGLSGLLAGAIGPSRLNARSNGAAGRVSRCCASGGWCRASGPTRFGSHGRGLDPAALRKAALIVEGYVNEAGLGNRRSDAAATNRKSRTKQNLADRLADESEVAAANFVAKTSADLESLIVRLARRHTGWFTRWRDEILLLVMLGIFVLSTREELFLRFLVGRASEGGLRTAILPCVRILADFVVWVVDLGVLQPVAVRASRCLVATGRRLANAGVGRGSVLGRGRKLPPRRTFSAATRRLAARG